MKPFCFKHCGVNRFDSFQWGERSALTLNFQEVLVDPKLHFFTGRLFFLRKQNPPKITKIPSLRIKTVAVLVSVFMKQHTCAILIKFYFFVRWLQASEVLSESRGQGPFILCILMLTLPSTKQSKKGTCGPSTLWWLCPVSVVNAKAKVADMRQFLVDVFWTKPCVSAVSLLAPL